MFTLREDQQRFVELINDSIRAGHRRILAQAPTGFGKGVVIADRVARAAARGRRVLVMAHREEIVSDLSARIHRQGVPHGMVASGWRMDTTHGVLVCSIDTLIRRLDKLEPPDVIIPDEAHHVVAGNKWGRVVDHWPQAYLIGFTATPERLDGRGLGQGHGGYFTDLVLGPSAAWLTYPGLEWQGLTSPGGLLSPLRLFLPPPIDLSAIAPSKRDTRKGLEEAGEILRRTQHVGDVIAHYLRTIASHHMGTALCYASSLRHAGSLCEAFREASIPAIVIDGDTDKGIRRQAFRDLADGSLKILLNVDIAGEGTDVPSVTGVIIDRITDSLALHLQMLGRSLRVAPGKEFAVCNDHVGNSRRHGLPTDPRDWSLTGARRRRDPSKAPPVRVCETCFATVPAQVRICPVCGHQAPPMTPREIVTVDGHLQLVDAVELQRQRQQEQQRQRRQAVGKARTREELELIRLERGYSRGWTDHILRARNGARAF